MLSFVNLGVMDYKQKRIRGMHTLTDCVRSRNHRFYFVHAGTNTRFLTKRGFKNRGFRALDQSTESPILFEFHQPSGN
jgi:hypothetical protein